MKNDTRQKAIFSIQNLHYTVPQLQRKHRKRETVVNAPFSLHIPDIKLYENTVTVFIGSNGSGKTTLLKLLNGLLPYSNGSILYKGNELETELQAGASSCMREEAVFVHQKPYLFYGSVFSNIQYVLKLKKLPQSEISERVFSALDDLGLKHLARQNVHTLSGGEKQRLAIARAIAINPKLLFLDEPTGSIDPGSTEKIESLIKKLANENCTVLMSTHNLASCYKLADHIVPLEKGRIQQQTVNVFHGFVEKRDEYFTYFRSNGVLLRCPAADGTFSVAVIPLDDVILSHNEIKSSAQNVLSGHIVSMKQLHEAVTTDALTSVYLVSIDCGLLIQACISSYSIESLRLSVGVKLHLAFKSSAIKLY